jgi:hypothetical protein
MLGRSILLLGMLLSPLASAGPLEFADDVVQYTNSVLEAARLPSCQSNTTVSCSDEGTYAGCGTDPVALYRCRLLLEGNGGELDGMAAMDLGAAVNGTGSEGIERAGITISRLAGGLDPILDEEQAWETWVKAQAFSFKRMAFAAQRPYEDLAKGFLYFATTEAVTYALDVAGGGEDALEQGLYGTVLVDYRFTASVDSGPVTLSATDRRPSDDPCDPGAGIRVGGSDCHGPILMDAMLGGSVDCNAYTTISTTQPCGGYESSDWDWSRQGTGLYPFPLRGARLTFGPDGGAVIHDAFGVLYCNEPGPEYQIQKNSVNVTSTMFKDPDDPSSGTESSYNPKTPTASVFGANGTCSVSGTEERYAVTYEVMLAPTDTYLRATGTFIPEGTAQAFVDCATAYDSHRQGSAQCEDGQVHA